MTTLAVPLDEPDMRTLAQIATECGRSPGELASLLLTHAIALALGLTLEISINQEAAAAAAFMADPDTRILPFTPPKGVDHEPLT